MVMTFTPITQMEAKVASAPLQGDSQNGMEVRGRQKTMQTKGASVLQHIVQETSLQVEQSLGSKSF